MRLVGIGERFGLMGVSWALFVPEVRRTRHQGRWL
jgi:hypothetical protein